MNNRYEPMFVAHQISQRFADFGTGLIGWIAKEREDKCVNNKRPPRRLREISEVFD